MIKDIVKNLTALQEKSISAIKADNYIVQDLIDTAEAHKDRCAGLAAIQIGYNKRICIIRNNEQWLVIKNPIIKSKSTNKSIHMEGCLSLDGEKEVERSIHIDLLYTDRNNKIKSIRLSGIIAFAAQHEIDHMNGVSI